MNYKRHPCKKDCPRRSGTCHATCEDWAKWEVVKAERYAQEDRERITSDTIGVAVRRMEKKKNSHH